MSGLIWKDILVMRKSLRTYGLLLLFYLAMVVMDAIPLTMVIAMVEVIIMILPVSAFSYDEVAKWDRYAAALPLGARRIVGARYLFAIGMAVVAAAFGALVCALMTILGGASATEGVLTVLTALAVGLAIADILLPLCYKMGPERARPFLYLIILVPSLGVFAGARLGILSQIDLSWLNGLSEGAVIGLFTLLPVAALVGSALSWLISCRIMSRKEF